MLFPRKLCSCHTLVALMLASSWILTSLRLTSGFVHRLDKCEPIAVPRCQAMPYNMTRMPNMFHHSTQENARLAFEQFHVLLDQNCSDVLLFLLCAMYVPICTVSFQPQPIPPCRGVCERARAGCEPVMNAYSLSWPRALNCSRLPRYERGVCVSPEAIVTPSTASSSSSSTSSSSPSAGSSSGGKARVKSKAGGGAGKRCRCKKRKKRVKTMFRQYKYDYAIRAQVFRRKRVDANTVTVKVEVQEVLFCGKVKFPRSNHVTLWTNSSCGCPKLRPGRQYLLAGHEDVRTGRFLLLSNTALALKWRLKWAARIKMWRQRVLRRKGLGTNRKRDNSRARSRSSNNRNRKSRHNGRKRKFSGKSNSAAWRNKNSKRRPLERRTLLTNRNLTR